jgi:hypothetical protein
VRRINLRLALPVGGTRQADIQQDGLNAMNDERKWGGREQLCSSPVTENRSRAEMDCRPKPTTTYDGEVDPVIEQVLLDLEQGFAERNVVPSFEECRAPDLDRCLVV